MNYDYLPDSDQASILLQEILNRSPASKPGKVSKPLVIYGAGDLGRMAKEYFDYVGVNIEFVVDLHAEQKRNDPFWKDLPILYPADVSKELRHTHLLVVCIANYAYSELHQGLASQGWQDITPFYDVTEAYRDKHPLGNGWFTGRIDPDDLSGINSVISAWEDDISRAHYIQFLAWHTLREDYLFSKAPIVQENRYFIPEVMPLLHDNETFLDIGAHHGNSIKGFLRVVEGKFDQIYAIEPDKKNISKLRAVLSSPGFADINNKIHILDCAVGVENGSLNFFEGAGYASQFSDDGAISVEVRTLNDLGLKPTFMKLHLEGWELNALQGGRKIIQESRPIIVSTSYHNALGLRELPGWFMRNLPDYKLYMRLHSWCGTGSVIYAIPQERYS